MPGNLPQLFFVYQRRNDFLVAALCMPRAPEIHKFVYQNPSVREPVGNPSGGFMEHEKSEFRPEHMVASRFSFLSHFYKCLQLFLRAKGNSINPLQLLIFLVAFPVGSRSFQKFYSADFI